MYINKHFKELNIEPLYKIDIREKCDFANKVAILLLDTFPEYDLDYLKIVDLLQHTDMYMAKVPKNLSPVNYSYKDEAMYISDEIKLDLNNEFIWHEVIHRIQEGRNKKNQLMQLGLCSILETKVQGLAMNEAAIQYIVHKMLKSEDQMVDIYEMKIPTISKNYYPIITNLIEQICFVLGDKWLIDSCLKSKIDFKYHTIDDLGEGNYFTIQANFDKILEAKDNVLKCENVNENIEIIKTTYIETEQLILTSYFDRIFKRIETMQELKKYEKKLFHYRFLIGSNEAQNIYIEYYNKQKEKIKQLEFDLQHKALIVSKDNIINRIFRKLVQWRRSKLGKEIKNGVVLFQKELPINNFILISLYAGGRIIKTFKKISSKYEEQPCLQLLSRLLLKSV